MLEELSRKEQEIWKKFVVLSYKDSIDEIKSDEKEAKKEAKKEEKETTYFSYFTSKISDGLTGFYKYFTNLIWRK